MIRRHRFLAVVVVLLAGAAAKGQVPPRTAAKAAPSDAALETAIRHRFAKSKAGAGFTVRVQGGVATLEGKTDVVQRKSAATRMAKTAGAKQVVNRIQVSDAAREKAASSLQSGRRRAQVKRSERTP